MRRTVPELPGRFSFLVSSNSPGLSRIFISISFLALLGAFALLRLGKMEETLKAPCILRAGGAPSEVRNAAAGRILRFPCSDGETVSKGQLLFEIDSGSLRIEHERAKERRLALEGRLRELREYAMALATGAALSTRAGREFASRMEAFAATLDAASLRVERIEKEIRREETLPDSAKRPMAVEGLYSERSEVFSSLEGGLAKERAQAEAELFQAGEEAKAALAQERDLAERIRACLVYAPISGTAEMGLRLNPGDYLFPGDGVMKIYPGEEAGMEAEISVPNDKAAELIPGMEVRYTFPSAPISGRRKIGGILQRVGKDVRGGDGSAASLSFVAHASLDIPVAAESGGASAWRPVIGMAAMARIISGRKTVLEWLLEKMDFSLE